jgi:hypothetical protein
MRSGFTYLTAGMLLWGVAAPAVHAQRGVGDQSGVARRAATPEIVGLEGKVSAVKTERCQMTTGRAYLGTHFVLKTADKKELNIHLGPAGVVDSISAKLSAGAKVKVKAFRTAAMPENHYVAQSLTIGDDTIKLRDENLRPSWAGGGAGWGGGAGFQRGGRYGGAGMGYGRGRGAGPRWGRGRGYGRGYGRGWGGGGQGWQSGE